MPFPGSIKYSSHARKRCLEGGYSHEAVRTALRDGETIEAYPDTGRGTSYLLLHWIEGRPVHVVAADKEPSSEPPHTLVITVYDPRTDSDEWTDHFSERRR